MLADEASHALAEFDESIGDRHFGEGIASDGSNVFAAGLADGVARVFKGEAGDDDLRKAGTRNVDSGPVAIGAEEDAIARFGELSGELVAGEAVALGEERALNFSKEVLAALVHLTQVEVTGEEHEGAALHTTAAPGNHVGQIIEVEAALTRVRCR